MSVGSSSLCCLRMLVEPLPQPLKTITVAVMHINSFSYDGCEGRAGWQRHNIAAPVHTLNVFVYVLAGFFIMQSFFPERSFFFWHAKKII